MEKPISTIMDTFLSRPICHKQPAKDYFRNQDIHKYTWISRDASFIIDYIIAKIKIICQVKDVIV